MTFVKIGRWMLTLSLCLSWTALNAGDSVRQTMERSQSGPLDIVWIEDDRFPLYEVAIYFADGALSDQHDRHGETDLMFSLLTSGTNRYTQKEISDALDFFGVTMDHTLTHEYAKVTVSGLVKDAIPTLKMVCHLFQDAVFPKTELSQEISRQEDQLKNLVASPQGLAERAFRIISMRDSSLQDPTDGRMTSIRRVKREHLLSKLDYFNKHVKKRIYITGPRVMLDYKDIFINECGWNAKTAVVERQMPKRLPHMGTRPQITLVRIPKANQASIQIGRYLSLDEVSHRDELLSVLSGYLGGGFTSKLMQELRVKRGLTYGVNAYAAGQKYYGRATIATSIRNEKAVEGITVIRDLLKSIGQGTVDDGEYGRAVAYLGGRHLFQFERTPDFMDRVMFVDHVGTDVERLYRYPELISEIPKAEVVKSIQGIFDWNKQNIVVVGDASLEKLLRQLGDVSVTNYSDYL